MKSLRMPLEQYYGFKENIRKYGGNPDKVAVTGDSAGGHLAEMVVGTGKQSKGKRLC